jgi:putative transposase
MAGDCGSSSAVNLFFKITALTWIVERSFAWLGRNRRLSKDYEYRVQMSETLIDMAVIRLMLNRIASG